MKTKRILSMALSAVMALSLVAPAFAADTGDDAPTTPANQTVITGSYEEADIDVVVPGTATAMVNPYGLGMSVATKADADVKVQIKGQIATAPVAIKNNTDMRLDVGASVIGAIAEGSIMKLAATTTQGSGTEGAEDYVAPATAKSAFVQLQAAPSKTAVADATDNDTVDDAILTDVAADATWTGATAVTVGTKAATVDKLATLEAATLDTDGTLKAYPAGSMMLFRLTGDCVKAPKVAWVAADSFTVTVAFTFAPAAPAASE